MSVVFANHPLPEGTYTITSYFGYRESPGGIGSTNHEGLDFGAPEGTEIYAVQSGSVIQSGYNGGYGNSVVVDHGGFFTIYAHMVSTPPVSVGQKVSAGNVIGYVGTTGNSTGNHLHFGLYIGTDWGPSTPEDPLPYLDGTISYGQSNSVGSSFSESYEEDYSFDVNNIPYTPLSIVGRRVSDLSTQPLYAYVNIYVGGKNISPTPNILIDFEIERFEGVGDTARFQLYDTTWGELERDLADNYTRIQVEYGYSGSTLKSKMYNFWLSNYSISFNSSGVIMNVEAISHGVYQNLQPVTIITDTKNPTEAIKIIGRKMGWTVLDENFDDTITLNDAANPFNIVNDFPVTYIKDLIQPVAKTTDGEILEFYLDDNDVVYFQKNVPASVDTNKAKEVRTYIYMKGYDSPVVDLTFDVKGVFGGTSDYAVATGGIVSVFDQDTREEVTTEETLSSVVTVASGTGTHTASNQSIASVNSAGDSVQQSQHRLYYHIKKAVTSQYQAKMVVLGDPTISLLEDIRIINMTDDGYLHHTSGIYKITGITDSISQGKYLTSVDAVRVGTINDGVELLHPKLVIK